MSDRPKKDKEIPAWQRSVAVATNAAGVAAGPAAIAMAVRQARRKQGGLPRAGAEKLAAKKPQSRGAQRIVRALRNPKVVAAGGVTAVGLQAANMFGDATAVQALTNRRPKEDTVKKDQQTFSNGVFTSGETGHGVNLEMVGKAAKKRAKCPNCEIPADRDGKCPMCGKDCVVSKAMRRYDSEADRQRRLGMYAGAGAGVAAVSGNELRRALDVVRGDQPKVDGKYVKGKRPVRGLKLKSGVSPRKAAILAALTAGGAAVGAGSYKRGVSRRNQPWT